MNIYPAYLYFKFWREDNFDNRFALKCAYIWVVIAQVIPVTSIVAFKIIDPDCLKKEAIGKTKDKDIDYFYFFLTWKLFYMIVYMYSTILVCRIANVQLVDFDSEK